MRHDAVIWSPRRPALKEIESGLAEACHVSLRRTTALITPLFQASPKYRRAQAEPERLKLVTLENGDYQQIHNPGDPNFDELFAEWPRLMIQYQWIPHRAFAGVGERRAVLECHDLETHWEKAGWTSGATLLPPEERQERHKLIFGLPPWGWPDRAALEAALAQAAESLARLVGTRWAFFEDPDGERRKRLARFFQTREQPQAEAGDPMADMRSIEDAEFGRI